MKEQDQDLRQEHDHRADARDDAVGQEAGSGPAGSACPGCRPSARGRRLEQVREGRRPGEHRLEDHEHHQRPAPTKPKTGAAASDPVRRRSPRCGAASSPPPKQAARFRMEHIGIRRGLVLASSGRRTVGGCGVPDIRRASPPAPARLCVAPQPSVRQVRRFALQLRQVDIDPATLRRIHHVDRQHHWSPELAHFQREAQMQAQVGRIHHAHDHVGRGFAGSDPRHRSP